MTGGAIAAAGLGPETPVTGLVGVGPRQRARLERIGITTVADVLLHLPRRYEDTREKVPIASLVPGITQTVRARVVRVTLQPSPKRRMSLVKGVLEDDTGTVDAVWFNQPFLTRQLHPGQEVILNGPVTANRYGLELRNPKFERVGDAQHHVGTLAAVYPETEGITSKYLRTLVEQSLAAAHALPDVLPDDLRASEALPGIAEAIRTVHVPESLEAASRARERIAYEELFLLQLAAERARRRRLGGNGVVIPYDVELARRFTASLPFELTTSQRVAAHQILTDMAADGPMNRLLQGDVGSGKTVVAAMAALLAHAAGFQTAVMAPTEILARQHHATLDALLTPLGLPPRLLVGSTTASARREVLGGLAGGHDNLVVGTHALIEDTVLLPHLGLVVVDEQHRFGVAQRQSLRLKTSVMPNFLAMTATPIPRTLALTMYGDVNVSELRELPPGRHPVETRVVRPHQRSAAYDFVRAQVREGRQVFVICPLVEESDKLGVRSATAEHERLSREVFPDLRVGLLHGRLPAREKEEEMARFAAGAVDVLVATSVVEVGVDVPNASLILIEAAERFGLAQLHQFRGRVGRGEHASFCLLFQAGVDDDAASRLELVASTSSGFELAELDLQHRGAGDISGLRQHGLPEMRAADLLDVAMLQRTRSAASSWLDHDPEITAYPPLAAAMHRYGAVFDLD